MRVADGERAERVVDHHDPHRPALAAAVERVVGPRAAARGDAGDTRGRDSGGRGAQPSGAGKAEKASWNASAPIAVGGVARTERRVDRQPAAGAEQFRVAGGLDPVEPGLDAVAGVEQGPWPRAAMHPRHGLQRRGQAPVGSDRLRGECRAGCVALRVAGDGEPDRPGRHGHRLDARCGRRGGRPRCRSGRSPRCGRVARSHGRRRCAPRSRARRSRRRRSSRRPPSRCRRGIEQQRQDRIALQRRSSLGRHREGGSLLVDPAARSLAQQVAVAGQVEGRQDRRRHGRVGFGDVVGGGVAEARHTEATARTVPASRTAATAIAVEPGSGWAEKRQRARGPSRSITMSRPAATAPPSGRPATAKSRGLPKRTPSSSACAELVDAPAAAVVDEETALGGDDRLAAGEGDRGQVGVLVTGRKRFVVPALAVGEQHAALADRVAARAGFGRVEGDVHQVAFEADRDPGVLHPEVVGGVPLPHRARSRRPRAPARARARRRRARSSWLTLPLEESRNSRASPARADSATTAPSTPTASAPESSAPAGGAGRRRHVGERRRGPTPATAAGASGAVFCGDLHRPLEPAAVELGEGTRWRGSCHRHPAGARSDAFGNAGRCPGCCPRRRRGRAGW